MTKKSRLRRVYARAVKRYSKEADKPIFKKAFNELLVYGRCEISMEDLRRSEAFINNFK
jgi:hypothetical protein